MTGRLTWTLVTMTVVLGIPLLGLLRASMKRKLHLWLPRYVAGWFRREDRATGRTIDVLFCFADHFEPGWNGVDAETERRRVEGWSRGYPAMARAFVDADGFNPRHTWFFPPHYHRQDHLDKLIELCLGGYGEIEMHLHHSRLEPFPDTSETLRRKIEDCIASYSKFGIFETGTEQGKTARYGFVHGDWALDNSRPEYCGVDDELTILRDTGCYADFTFPAYGHVSQPRVPNSIFYAIDDPARPASHVRGTRARVGVHPRGDLLIVQGPLGIRWHRGNGVPLPKVDDGEISANNPPTEARVDFWIRTGIHVAGRPEWVVVKVFTHGAAIEEQPALLGEPIRRMHAYLAEKYNDGLTYRLHYVSARELYNIIKAAEEGREGNAGAFRDFLIQAYAYRRPAGPQTVRQ